MSTRVVLVLLLLAGCATPPPRPPARPAPPPILAADEPARHAARAFLDAATARDGDAMLLLLSDRWRARLSPDRLLADLDTGGAIAADRLARARLALLHPATLGPTEARFELDAEHALRLVRESDGWKLDELP